MKLNRLYYKHLRQSIIIVVVGLALILKVEYPEARSNVSFFNLIMVVLSAFFGVLSIVTMVIRFERGPKFRRKFSYCFFAVADVAIAGLSLPLSILQKAGIFFSLVYFIVFLIGLFILWDIYFGKRDVRVEQEMLMS